MEKISLNVEKREGKGTKKGLSSLRAGAKIPGVIYGGDKPPLQVALSEKELLAARKKGGVNAILHLKIGSATETVIVKGLQRHPVTDRPVHADFQRVSLSQKIEAKVPLHIAGEAPGAKAGGGVLQHELRELHVKGPAGDIPAHIEVDVSRLEIGQHILVRELKVPAGLELLDAPDHLVVHVTVVKEEVAAAPAVPVEGEAPAEPELSQAKGKKDEEGKPIPKEAKAPAAGEKEKAAPAAKKETAK